MTTAEPPATPQQKIGPGNPPTEFWFSGDRAREIGRLGGLARAKNREGLPTPTGNINPLGAQIRRLEKHIARIDKQLEEIKVPSEWRDLTQARTRLFADWQTLTGLERPAVRRAPRTPRNGNASDPQNGQTPQPVVVGTFWQGQNVPVSS